MTSTRYLDADKQQVVTASCSGFWPNILAQMSKNDSDSEQSYCSDDLEFNYIPGPYVIEAVPIMKPSFLHQVFSKMIFR